MTYIFMCLLVILSALALGTFFRVSATKKKIPYALLLSFFSLILYVDFLVWSILESRKGTIDKDAPITILKHMDDAMFIIVICFGTIINEVQRSNKNNDNKDGEYKFNLYNDIKSSYC